MAVINGRNVRDVLRGTTGADQIFGLAGDDILYGLDGGDRLEGGLGNDQLYGGNQADTILGGDGNDLLDGGTGIDNLQGGLGNDTYIMTDVADIIVDTGGFDTARLTGIERYVMAGGLENLTIISLDSAGTFVGNALANVIDAGQSGPGFDRNVTLDGGAGNDRLLGGTRGDLLNGGLGADNLTGRGGDDTYVVDNRGDVVSEVAFAGEDTVHATVSYTMPNNVEALVLKGAGAINATGSTGDDRITGNAAANAIRGGLGDDTLVGGAGADRFVFGAIAESSSETAVDAIVDFASNGGAGDKIDLSLIDANPSLGGDQQFRFIGQMTKQNDWPEVGGNPEVGVVGFRIDLSGNLFILANTDLDSTPDLVVLIGNGGAVDANWFIL